MSQYHNVIIFGAGASADAGIPMLDSFVNKMWEYAARGKVGKEPISDHDKDILTKADKIRIQLERYNTRASFNDRNLEDILSLLSFEALAGGEYAASYEILVKAVARTIELSCKHKYQNSPPAPFANSGVYHAIWNSLLNKNLFEAGLALITFNYDLVIERTLWEHFHHLNRIHGPFPSCGLKYFLGNNDFIIKSAAHKYTVRESVATGRRRSIVREDEEPLVQTDGQKPVFALGEKADIEIPYLKLHGSLNWNQDNPLEPPPTPPTQSVEKPLILPPVFNKMNSREIYAVWKKALDILRGAKNIIIVGYSLPKTDVYMQYFLKSAVGPNSDLQKIIVFNPTFFEKNNSPLLIGTDNSSSEASEMKSRYLGCFSQQFGDRIIFEPMPFGQQRGTLIHFSELLAQQPQSLLFYP